jgi:hypothetical protein
VGGQFGVALALWLAFLAFQVGKAHVQKCSTQYWLLFGGQVTLLMATTALVVGIQYRNISGESPNLSPEIKILLKGGEDHGVLPSFALVVLTGTLCFS